MTFDDQIRRAFDTLSDRLRGEIEHQIQAAMDELAATARADRDSAVEAAVTSARAERDAAVEAAFASARQERDAAVEVAAAAAARTVDNGPVVVVADRLEQVAAGVRAMSLATSLSGVLDALMSSAAALGAMTNIWLVRGGQLEPWRHANADAPPPSVAIDADNPIAEVVRAKAPASRDEITASPLILAGDVVAVLVTASPQRLAPSPNALDVLALYASRALEAITAFKTARALAQQTDEPRAGGAAMPGAHAINDEEHISARRYAKLLVSEVRLYHEAEVVSGRRDRDLMLRLGGEIAHARVMYEQRVPPHVRQQADYFHDELVRTLANGDPALLEVRS
jgi:hypothetical protein